MTAGIVLRTKLTQNGEKVRITNGFGNNVNIENNIQHFFTNDTETNNSSKRPHEIYTEKVDGSDEVFARLGTGGADGVEENPMTVKAKKLTVKYSRLKKKNCKYKRKKYLTVKKAKGKVTYKKLKGNKKFSINKKTGKLTVKKGLKKGTYRIKVRVYAKGRRGYMPKKKTVKVTVKVK